MSSAPTAPLTGPPSGPGPRSDSHASVAAGTALAACPCCGLVQGLCAIPARQHLRCVRCHTRLRSTARKGARRRATGALALAALLLYPVAVSLPFMEVTRLGRHHTASIWSGTVELLSEGELLVGGVVLVCSLLLPLAKLGALFVLSGVGERLGHRMRATTWHLVEWSGRWGMLDVLLVAVLVATVKLGDLVDLTAGPGATAFTVFVLLNLAASASFDPHALWEEPS